MDEDRNPADGRIPVPFCRRMSFAAKRRGRATRVPIPLPVSREGFSGSFSPLRSPFPECISEVSLRLWNHLLSKPAEKWGKRGLYFFEVLFRQGKVLIERNHFRQMQDCVIKV